MNITDQNPASDRLQPILRPLRPLNDRILVRRLHAGEGSIFLPEANSVLFMPECAQVPSKRGEVVAVGPGKRDEYGKRRVLDVKVGDIVYFGRYTDFDDGELLLIEEADVVGVVT